mmetsp:Transcript_20274/g.17499  ORF Transcript_20274/g.17499 Transcript_20274/m.17499 type:complete len:95 (+) Transcript_20274:2030-2314(+)
MHMNRLQDKVDNTIFPEIQGNSTKLNKCVNEVERMILSSKEDLDLFRALHKRTNSLASNVNALTRKFNEDLTPVKTDDTLLENTIGERTQSHQK